MGKRTARLHGGGVRAEGRKNEPREFLLDIVDTVEEARAALLVLQDGIVGVAMYARQRAVETSEWRRAIVRWAAIGRQWREGGRAVLGLPPQCYYV